MTSFFRSGSGVSDDDNDNDVNNNNNNTRRTSKSFFETIGIRSGNFTDSSCEFDTAGAGAGAGAAAAAAAGSNQKNNNNNNNNNSNSNHHDSGIWVGPDELIANRFLSKEQEKSNRNNNKKPYDYENPIPSQNFQLRLKNGTELKITNSDSSELYDDACSMKLDAQNLSLKNRKGKLVAKCMDDGSGSKYVICGTTPLLLPGRDERKKDKLFPWIEVAVDLKTSELSVDVWNGRSYTPLWYAEHVDSRSQIDLLSSVEEEGDLKVAEFHKGVSWYITSARGFDPAIFICTAAILMKLLKPELSSTSSNNNNNNKEEENKQSRFRKTQIFRMVKGAVVAPWSDDCDNKSNVSAADMDTIWVGPDEIIKNRFLSKYQNIKGGNNKNNNRKNNIIPACTLNLTLEENQVQILSHDGKEPYEGGSVLQFNTEDFILKNTKGKPVAKCIDDSCLTGNYVVCGTCPLFGSDEKKEKKGGYYPWIQVSIDKDDELAVDIWNGHSYTPLWYAEHVKSPGSIDLMSSVEEEGATAVGKFTKGDSWSLSTTEGFDPILYIFVVSIVMKIEASYKTNDLVAGKQGLPFRRSQGFRMVKGSIIDAYVSSKVDDTDYTSNDSVDAEEDAEWVGPDKVIFNRFLSKYKEKEHSYSFDNPVPAYNLRLFLQDDVLEIKEIDTGEFYAPGTAIKFNAHDFVLKNSVQKTVAKCIEDCLQKRYTICGTSPLFRSDDRKERTSANTYYPWLLVRLGENSDLFVDLWNGHSYAALWYAKDIYSKCHVEFLTVTDGVPRKVGEIKRGLQWDIQTTEGIDPSLFICVTSILMMLAESDVVLDAKAYDFKKTTKSNIFRMTNKGTVVSSYWSDSSGEFDDKSHDSADTDGIWVGPDEIIENRFLSKYQSRGNPHNQDNPIMAQNLKLVRDGQNVQIHNTVTGELYEAAQELKLDKKSFVLKNHKGKSVTKCIDDNFVKNKYAICGTNPLFTTDERQEKTDGTTYYPWIQVTIDEGAELSIDVWNGYNYSPMWYAENIFEPNNVDLLSSVEEEGATKVGGFTKGPTWDIQTSEGFDPSIFICTAAILMKITEFDEIANNTPNEGKQNMMFFL